MYFSKIVMLQRLEIVIISPFSVEYILFFSEIEMVIITWQEVFVSTILICNHTRDCQIELPLRSHPIPLISRMFAFNE